MPEDDLPAEGVRLAAHGRKLPVLSDDPVTLAQRTQRDLLLVTVKSENHGQRIDAGHAARVLVGIQELVRLLATPAAKRLTRFVADVNTLCLTGLFSGSVGMTLESKYPSDLAGTYTADALSALIRILKAGDSPEALGMILPGLRKGARRRYRFLLQSLNKAGSGLGAVWASPLGTREDADVALGQVSRIMEIMGEDEEDSVYEFQTHGSLVLIGIVEETKRRKGRTVFEFESDEGDWLKGTLDDSLIDRVRTKGVRFLVPAHDVDAKVQEITEVNSVTGDETVAYVLLDISRLPGESA